MVSCLATVWEPEQARDFLEFPDDMHLRLAIAFGYPKPEDAVSRAARKGGRRTLEDQRQDQRCRKSGCRY